MGMPPGSLGPGAGLATRMLGSAKKRVLPRSLLRYRWDLRCIPLAFFFETASTSAAFRGIMSSKRTLNPNRSFANRTRSACVASLPSCPRASASASLGVTLLAACLAPQALARSPRWRPLCLAGGAIVVDLDRLLALFLGIGRFTSIRSKSPIRVRILPTPVLRLAESTKVRVGRDGDTRCCRPAIG
jgi:hypothetical protein